jgi:hypothetical protein
MVAITILPNGASLDRISEGRLNQQVFISAEHWGTLCQIAPEIQQAMERSLTKDWIVGACGSAAQEQSLEQHMNLKAVVSVFQSTPYLNIRIFVGEKATRQGVTLPPSEWQHLTEYLHDTDEMKAGKDVWERSWCEEAKKKTRSQCQGCKHNKAMSCASHSCDERDMMEAALVSTAPTMTPLKFQRLLASECEDREIIMDKPAMVFSLINMYNLPHIKHNILKDYQW